ncbi:polysaccharide biosynthesis protein [Beggiatoa leptomitoformis]|uniref:NAD-dependent epimerase/dehydratase family protein n=1 Tax=Beggiatoa leptomitoformis TaxID=288004 RepID=A0A2N9YCJ7_9GAMM|nr:nucleoside-diphosphate sugar epimerase/dehydratase [Beggiatoa leptomitoformis]ALG66532.1 NAD-dependent epimerase/dehydratase family protein [Beggiatoa leptomitoformis]AUI68172.1 NAD-dependent epimerase/dehydratase family protein [Beggiatoa leptomitoformis]
MTFPPLLRLPVLLHDFIMVALAWTLALILRYDFPFPEETEAVFLHGLPIVVSLQSLILWYYDVYKGIWQFSSLTDLLIILRAVVVGTILVILALVLFNRLEGIPRLALFFYPIVLIILLGVPRLLTRLWYEHSFHFLLETSLERQRLLVLGAGTSGEMLVRDMRRSHGYSYVPVGFLDDRHRLHGGRVQGLPVLGSIENVVTIVKTHAIDAIVIAMPSASDSEMQRVVDYCEQAGVPFRTLPKLQELSSQSVNLNHLREVEIDDLLGREKVQLDWMLIQAGIANKVVMVSGGGGSIGAELCRQIARLNPQAIVILEQCEFNLYKIDLQLRAEFPQLSLHICLGDIVDSVLVQQVFRRYQPQVVFHAAAYKHVPMLQEQTRAAIRNNVLGTKTLAEMAVKFNCPIFVMISTDKAVNPTNIMGATKRAAEIFCQGLNARSNTHFITVRFGNVLGSAGSVVPLFKAQIAKGGPVTVTDPEITRYFMTIPEACQLILQAGTMGKGGEIFVLDMGKPIKISYLAEQMIRLSGHVPNQTIKIVYTGLRSGEKLHEELFYAEEILNPTTHPKILLAAQRPIDWTSLQGALTALSLACKNYDDERLQVILNGIVPELNLTD